MGRSHGFRLYQLHAAAVGVLARAPPGRYPNVAAAVAALGAAIAAEFPKRRGKERRRSLKGASKFYDPADAARIYRRRGYRLKAERDRMAADLAKHVTARSQDGRLSEEWIQRVICCAPHASARSLASAFHLANGRDAALLSRPSIGKIKDVWADVYAKLVLTATGAAVARESATTGGAVRQFLPVFAEHCQDEADVRVLSGHARDGPKIPRRQRASKVQIHCLTLACGDYRQRIASELEALGDKRGATLATSCERLLREKIAPLLQPQAIASHGRQPAAAGACGEQPPLWFVHILVGDAVSANETAAKLLLRVFAQRPLVQGGRYFLLLVKCGTHQAALTAKSGVEGRIATAAAWANPKAPGHVTATAVRLYKYLLADYYEQLVDSVRRRAEWVVAQVR